MKSMGSNFRLLLFLLKDTNEIIKNAIKPEYKSQCRTVMATCQLASEEALRAWHYTFKCSKTFPLLTKYYVA